PLRMSAGFGNLLTLVLLTGVAVFAVRFLLRRFGPGPTGRNTPLAPQGMQYAGAGIPGAFGSGSAVRGTPEASLAATPAAAASSLPPGFDAPAFERIAKLIFI